MSDKPLWALDLTDLSRRIAAGQVTSRQMVEVALDRISQFEPSLHAFATLSAERARADADRADAEIAAGRLRGPLHGVPIAVKDAIDTEDPPAMFGNPVLNAGRRGRDAKVMRRLDVAGAVRLGKLALTDGVWLDHHPSRPAPVHPRDTEAWTGTSSSGSGVALAAGFCWGSLGTDTGGSIRMPSASCGVTGLKPGWGRITTEGVQALAPSLDNLGPMARSANDVAAIFRAVANPPIASKRTKLAMRNLRVGIYGAAIASCDDEVCHALEETVRVFEILGSTIHAVSLPDPAPIIDAWAIILSVEAAETHADRFASRRDDYTPSMRSLLDRGTRVDPKDLAMARAFRQDHAARLAALMADIDILLLPALPFAGMTTEAIAAIGSDDASARRMGAFTVPFNMCDLPTLTLPGGRTTSNLPIGFQLCGPATSELDLCRIGMAFQNETDWHRMFRPR